VKLQEPKKITVSHKVFFEVSDQQRHLKKKKKKKEMTGKVNFHKTGE
jgi:hypothetical protein